MGEVRVDGIPARFSKTPWRIARSAPCLGEHNQEVFERLLGLSADDVAQLRAEKVI
jgi:crotonobetainyl-CoA:carnitine CoA-transferase CaiB-like acyl-CoA transferase